MTDPSLALAPRLIADDLARLAGRVPSQYRRLFIFGLGYTGQYIARALTRAGWEIGGTTRQQALQHRLQADGIRAVGFDRVTRDLIAGYGQVLSTIGPARDQNQDADQDPVLGAFAAVVADAKPRWVGYFSATSVYGAAAENVWVDEDFPTEPTTDRGIRRLAVEQQWAQWAASHNIALSRFRIAGIYGPGRNILEQLTAGTARVVDKPGHLFNRVHVEDIARAVTYRMIDPKTATIDNLADGMPLSQKDWTAKAAAMLGIAPPAPIPFDDASADMSPMGRSFWQDSKRIKAPRFG